MFSVQEESVNAAGNSRKLHAAEYIPPTIDSRLHLDSRWKSETREHNNIFSTPSKDH